MTQYDPDALFHASQIELLIPSLSSCPAQPEDPSSSSWWSDARGAKSRDIAFLDERLEYYVGLSIDEPSPGAGDGPSLELKHFLSRLQLTMTASFLPPMIPSQSQQHRPARPNSAGSTSTSNSSRPTLQAPNTSPRSGRSADFPPVTPMPQPSVRDGDEQYAGVEGQVVWEGEVLDKYVLYKGKRGGWVAVWKGEVHIAYVRTNIQDPVLGLTASVTLRDAPVRAGHKRGNFSIDTISTRGVPEDLDDETGEYGANGLAGMEHIDLLGGLAGGSKGIPASRLGASMRQDLSIPDSASAAGQVSAYTPNTMPSYTPTMADPSGSGPRNTLNDQGSSITLRKSYRRVLGLSPGLRVRMRTLYLPQLLPATASEDDENEGEKKIVLCVEIENPDSETLPFEIEGVNVDIGGKGGKATAQLVCQPEQMRGGEMFPLRLQVVEQYNLLYGVEIAASPEERSGAVDEAVMRTMGRGDDSRPAAISIIGRPYAPQQGSEEVEYPTKAFHTRWNCQLDLTAFYASLATNSANGPLANHPNRLSKTPAAPPAPVAGDKRYSLATLASDYSAGGGGKRDSRRLTQRPIMPSQAMGYANGNRITSGRQQHPSAVEGLLISVKLLPPSSNSSPMTTGFGSKGQATIRPFESFSIEVFVHNRTDEVRRFRLSIPSRDGESQAQIRDIIDKRKSQRQSMVRDDPIMRQLLARHLASAPAIIPLESDVRCGPVLPGASLAARMRFMALREGVHTLDKLVITGLGDDWNHVMSPVLDVVVSGSD